MVSERQIISISRIGKTYRVRGGQVDALKDFTLSVDDGEFVAIVGESGCGKTTLLRIIAGLTPRSSGNIMIKDRLINGPSEDIGMVFQSPVLLPWRDVLNNILLPIEMRGLRKNDYLHTAKDLIELVGLDHFMNMYPHELSGGMQQRASLCRALVSDPSILLMDEPFGALDALTRERMNLELLRIWSRKKKTVLFVTHSIQEAVFLADRVVVMTPRPGSVAGILKVELPHPRDIKTLSSQKYFKRSADLREMLESQNGRPKIKEVKTKLG